MLLRERSHPIASQIVAEKMRVMSQNTNRRSEGGFSILELAIVIAILAPMLTIVLSGTGAVVDTSVGAAAQVGAQRQVIFTMKRLRTELQKAQIDSVSPDGLSVTYREALDLAGSGVPVNTAGVVQWGAMEAAGPVEGNTYTIRFIQDDLASEATLQLDLNSDGDMTDTFLVGRLERVTTLGAVRQISPSICLVDSTTPNGDLDGDGLPDSMFNLGPGRALEVRLLTRFRLADSRRGSEFSRLNMFLPNMEE